MARLAQYVPVIIVLLIVFIVVYLYMARRKSPNRAKEVTIKILLVLTIIITVVFGLCSLYAWSEHNINVLEITMAFMIVGAVALVITLICRAVFLHHHPDYKHKPMKTWNINSFWDNFRNFKF